MCDSSQRLVEGGRVAVVGERDTHASRQEPSGQREGLLVLEEPRPEALVVDFVALQGCTGHKSSVISSSVLSTVILRLSASV